MIKLLKANLARLWTNKVFWLGFLVLNVFCIIQKISIIQDTVEVHFLEEAFWIQAYVIGIILSVFISLFIGAEYEYGTIRNKIISGYDRSDIYLANIFTCIIAGWIMCMGCLISSLLVGVPFLGFFHIELSEILLQGICVFALSAAYTAIYCFFAMLIHNRTITAIACIMLSFLLLFSGTVISNRLDESEYYYIPDASLGIGEIDDGSHSEWIRNPDYLEGTERRIYEIFFEAIPGGQSLQLSGMLNEHTSYIEMFSASLVWIVLSCGCGVILFRRKDLK